MISALPANRLAKTEITFSIVASIALITAKSKTKAFSDYKNPSCVSMKDREISPKRSEFQPGTRFSRVPG